MKVLCLDSLGAVKYNVAIMVYDSDVVCIEFS